jgi:hypothetical protein
MKNLRSEPDFSGWGKAAAIPGFQLAIEHLQAVLDGLRADLADAQNGSAPRKRGRPEGSKAGPQAGYWAALSAEERSAEMKRRMAVAKANGGGRWPAGRAKLHPRDPRSPKHAQWLKKMAKANRDHWAGLSPKARKQRVDAMKRARTKQAQTARAAVTEARQPRANGAAA